MVVGENAGSKYDRAKELKVPILSEAEFEKLVGMTDAEYEKRFSRKKVKA